MNEININSKPNDILFCVKTLLINAMSEMVLYNYEYYRIGLPIDIELSDIQNVINNFNNTNKSFKIVLLEDNYHNALIVYKM